MVFPVESDEQVKRRVLTVCQDHVRNVLEIVRKVVQMIDGFANDDKKIVKDLFHQVKELEDKVDTTRHRVAKELAEIGGLLRSREDFLRFVYETGEISDFCEGIGFRLLEIMVRGWKVPLKVKKNLVKFSEAVLETIIKLRETTITLNYNAEKSWEKAREVEIAERNVDEIYRELEITILNGKMKIPVLLLLRDVTRLLEDVSDKAEDASDAARLLALGM
jgi:predicted phosphate transport protein (TIGR00153 family)